jgi:hypothetical protein
MRQRAAIVGRSCWSVGRRGRLDLVAALTPDRVFAQVGEGEGEYIAGYHRAGAGRCGTAWSPQNPVRSLDSDLPGDASAW